MAFENFRPKPKQETIPVVTENTTETKESLEGQIEQETVKLDTNLESLKADIQEMGGLQALVGKIESHRSEGKIQMIASGLGISAVIGLLGAAEYGGMYLDSTIGTVLLSALGLSSTAIFAFEAKIGIKNWLESRKLKSLKNKAEKAGIV
jgi:capsule polysaccharide export protein KpsE/RkpR